MAATEGKMAAGAAAMTVLLVISSVNILPSLKRGAYGLAGAQFCFALILAIIPFVSRWNAETRKRLTFAFMLGNGFFAFVNVEHWDDDARIAQQHHIAWTNELPTKRAELEKLGQFTPTADSQVGEARSAAEKADTDKATAKTSADNAQTELRTAKARAAECKKQCSALKQEATRLEGEAVRLEAEATQKEREAKEAHDKLQQLSGWRTLTEQAAPIQARINFLNEHLAQETYTGEVKPDSDSNLFQKGAAIFIAFLVELGNRFGPEGVFFFIIGLFANVDTRGEEREAAQGQSGPRGPRTKIPAGGPRPIQGGNIVSMNRSRAVHDQRFMDMLERSKVVLDQRFSGLSQRQIADRLGWSKTMVQRAQSYKPGPIHAVA